jgi:hypothetical protein
MDTLSGAKLFSILDLKCGYWQVDLHPDDKKIAFVMGQGMWQLTVTPFGLCNVPVMLQRLMETHFRVMSRVPGRRDVHWPHVPNVPAQPAESVPAVLKNPPYAESGRVPTFSEGSIVPRSAAIFYNCLA